MKVKYLILGLCLGLGAFEGKAQPATDWTLWYKSPAQAWEEALPVGNGRLGAMVFGKTDSERIQFNENTLYSGGPERPLDISVPSLLPQVRKLLKAGKNAEAGELMQAQWIGRLNEAYQPCGDLWIDFARKGVITDYVHSLDMERAVVTTSYKEDGVQVKREVFASYPAQAIVVRMTAEKPVLNFTARLSSEHPAKVTGGKDGLSLQGQAPSHAQRRDIANMRKFHTERLHPEYFNEKGEVIREAHVIYGEELKDRGMRFEAALYPLSYEGESCKVVGNRMEATRCSEVVFVIYAATSYNGPDKSPVLEGLNPHQLISEAVRINQGKTFSWLYEEHVNDFRSLFNRVDFRLPASEEQKALPTDERLKRFHQQEDPMLIAQLFQFGRYLMISGSRGNGQPLNLQGLWNDKVLPPWNSGYTLNINLEMNYWPAEVTNLSECHQPLFGFLEGAAERGKKLAHDMYGLDGWAIHHNISIWREAYPSDGFVYWFFWNTSGAWLCSHIWEHYLYTEDTSFLRRYYPILREACRFYAGWLVKNDKGEWVTPVSTSPENAYLMPDGTPASVCEGSTMDQALIRHLFRVTVKAAGVLNTDKDFALQLEDKLEDLKGYQIGSKGQLLEWDKEYGESEPQHRHVSHLFGLYPGYDITADNAPVFEAARKSLEARGNRTTGWSMAWKISLWSRLYEAEKAHEALTNLVNFIDAGKQAENQGGLYRNLLNALPFQIDGNFGATAGIAEMLLQSHRNNIHLLPALPLSWKEGSISGLKARGGFTVSLAWKEGRLQTAEITSASDKEVEVVYQGQTQRLNFKPGETKCLNF